VESRDVFPYLRDADLVKFDIEGGEWELIADPRFSELDAKAVVFEYHPEYGPRERAEELLLAALHAAGYRTGAPRPGWDAGMLWAWRPAAG
jgi:hypothetical protein